MVTTFLKITILEISLGNKKPLVLDIKKCEQGITNPNFT